MTDEINSNSDDLVNSANSLIAVPVTPIPPTPTCNDAKPVVATPCDGDFQSDTDSEKPVILELGAPSSITTSTAPATVQATEVNLYPRDMQHLSNTTAIYVSHAHPSTPHTYPYTSESPQSAATHHIGLTTHIGMYPGNPFDLRSAFSSHIPHTVCTWPVSDVEATTKVSSEIVPPPLYASYMGTRELSIVKETNPSWKEKALQIEKDYKKTACDRERTRMRDMNRAFDLLRSKLPISKPNGKKYSKIESLRIAINYIHHLQECLKADPQDFVKFSPMNKANSRNMTLDYTMDTSQHRQAQSFAPFDNNSTKDKSHNGAWSDIPNSQDQWD